MITAVGQQKANGAYYTPEAVARTLVRWVVRQADDRLLDPFCGDGRFLEHHANSVGVEFDAVPLRPNLPRIRLMLIVITPAREG